MPDAIPPEFQQFVEQEVASGNYPSAAAVISDGLRLLREQKMDDLRQALNMAAEQLDRGEGIVLRDEQAVRDFFEDIKSRGRERIQTQRNAK